MSVANPIPRQTRQAILTASAAQAVFGPFDFILYDAGDVQVRVRSALAVEWTLLGSDAYSVAPAAPATAFPALFTVTLDVGRGAGDEVWIRGARLGSRTTDVTRAGVLRSQSLETELDRQVATEQELRRDIDALIAGGAIAELIASGVGNDSTAPGGTVGEALGSLNDRLVAGLHGFTIDDAGHFGVQSITANTARFEGNVDPLALVPGSVGVEIGDNGTFAFIQTAVRPIFDYGPHDLHIISGGAIVFNTGGFDAAVAANGGLALNTRGGFTEGLRITQSPSGVVNAANTPLNLVYSLNTIELGSGDPDTLTFQGVTLATNGATASGNNVLHFAAVPAGVQVGMYVSDQTVNASIGQNILVQSKTSTTVTLTGNVGGAGVALGHSILFASSGAWINGFTITQGFGGSEVTTGRQTFYVYLHLDEATNWGNGNNQYVAGVFNAQANSSDGGTDLAGNAKGGVFSLNTIAKLNPGAVNFNEVGVEFDTAVLAGASVKYKNVLSLVLLAEDAVRGSSFDAGLSISAQSSASIGLKNGVLFSDANNGHAVGVDGTLIATQHAWTVVNGIDFSSYAFTGSLLKGPGGNFNIDGPTGSIGTKGSLSMLGATSGSVTVGAQAVAGTTSLSWPTVNGTLVSAATAPLTISGAGTVAIATTANRLIGTDGSGNGAAITLPAAGLVLSAGALALANDLSAIEGLSGTGLAVRTGTDTWIQRALAGQANRITVTNGDGVAGAPTIDISAAYVGQATIATLGTIAAGVWNGTAIAAANGGTGQAGGYAVGDLLYASGASALSKLAGVATGNALISGGVTTAPSWGKVTSAHLSGTANRLLGLDGSGNGANITLPAAGLTLSAGAIALANDLSALEGLSGTGHATRTGTDAWSLVGENGTGNVVLTTSAALVTPNIGAATGTSINLTGGATLAGNFSVNNSQNSQLNASVSNVNAGASAYVSFDFITNAGELGFLCFSTASGNKPEIYSTVAGDFIISAQGAGGTLSLQSGGATTTARLQASGGFSVGNVATDPGAGKITVTTAYNVGASQVVGARDTGWTAMTGTPDKATAFATATVTLAQLAGRVMSMQASLTTHGLLGA